MYKTTTEHISPQLHGNMIYALNICNFTVTSILEELLLDLGL